MIGRSVKATAPGKINLQLWVGEPGSDGYHPLVTVFQAVDLLEEVTVTWASAGAGISCEVTSPSLTVPYIQPANNLAVRAATLLKERTGTRVGAHIHILKRVPVAGGMAGGSADAAATLVACNRLWGLGMSRTELRRIGRELGSDVPFCLNGNTAAATGRGDMITQVLCRGTYHWVLIGQEWGLRTPEVFNHFDRLARARGGFKPLPLMIEKRMMAALATGSAMDLSAQLYNDLQEPALQLYPELRGIIEIAENAGALAAIISGSGPTVAALCLDEDHAQNVVQMVSSWGISSHVYATSGPVPGARVCEDEA